jgi:signal peptidase II
VTRVDFSRLGSFVGVLVACVGCDRAAKEAADVWLASGEPIAFAGDTVRFQLVENTGAFLSLGAALPESVRNVLFLALVPALLAAAFVWLVWFVRVSRAEVMALALVAGGGLGNWIDRWLHAGAVTDFVSIGLGPLRTGIFNVADVAVMAGALLLVLLARRREKPAEPKPEQ